MNGNDTLPADLAATVDRLERSVSMAPDADPGSSRPGAEDVREPHSAQPSEPPD